MSSRKFLESEKQTDPVPRCRRRPQENWLGLEISRAPLELLLPFLECRRLIVRSCQHELHQLDLVLFFCTAQSERNRCIFLFSSPSIITLSNPAGPRVHTFILGTTITTNSRSITNAPYDWRIRIAVPPTDLGHHF